MAASNIPGDRFSGENAYGYTYRTFRDLRESDPRFVNKSLYEIMAEIIQDGIAERHKNPQEQDYADRIEAARIKCRAGNPFPLMALQWPMMVLQNPEEISLFRAASHPSRYANRSLPDGMLSVLSDDSNPPLRLDWWQRLIIAAFFDISIAEIYVKGCTGAGKGGSIAMAVNLWFDVFDPSRTTLTSESHDHATANIYGEVRLWRDKMTLPAPARILAGGFSDHERHYITVRNPAAGGGESFSGQHGPQTLYVFDEATSIDDILFENAEKNATKIVAAANPRTLGGRFRRAFDPLGKDHADETAVVYGNMGPRLCVTVGGADCINVANGRLRKAVSPRGGIKIGGQDYQEGKILSAEHFEQVKALIPDQIDVTLFRNNCSRPEREADVYAHGRFPKEDTEKQVILDSWLPRHIAHWERVKDSIKIQAFGLDVARSLEGDETVLAPGGEMGVRDLHAFRLNSTVSIANRVEDIAEAVYGINLRRRTTPVVIDYGGGYGSGVGDILNERGIWVVEFHPGGGSDFRQNYLNRRTDGYAILGKRLDPRHTFGETPYALPPDDMLREELCAPEKVYVGNDGIRFGLTSKDAVKEKLGRSPDRGDAVSYLFAGVRIIADYDRLLKTFAGRTLIMSPVPTTKKELEAVKSPSVPLDSLPNQQDEIADLFGEIKLDLNPAAAATDATAAGKPVDNTPPAPGSRPDRYSQLAQFYRSQYGSQGD